MHMASDTDTEEGVVFVYMAQAAGIANFKLCHRQTDRQTDISSQHGTVYMYQRVMIHDQSYTCIRQTRPNQTRPNQTKHYICTTTHKRH